MHVAELWRYPVKSMAAESLTRAEIRADGIVGDRVVHVRGAHGRVVTARTRPRLLGHRATLGPDGEPLVDGRPWRAPEVAQDVIAAVGAGARLVRDDGVERFDVLRRINREFDGRLALNCYVVNAGAVAVGDPVELVA